MIALHKRIQEKYLCVIIYKSCVDHYPVILRLVGWVIIQYLDIHTRQDFIQFIADNASLVVIATGDGARLYG